MVLFAKLSSEAATGVEAEELECSSLVLLNTAQDARRSGDPVKYRCGCNSLVLEGGSAGLYRVVQSCKSNAAQ